MTDLFWFIVFFAVLGSFMGVGQLFIKVGLNAEWSRKTVHIGVGCFSLGFPFMFENRLTVFYLVITAISVFSLLRFNEKLSKGNALLGVERKSFGEFYFLAAILAVFMLHQEPYEYLIPMAILTFADSIAALVGVKYGRFRISHFEEGAKSGEGSMMLFIVAFFCTLIPLQLMSEVGRVEVLVIAFLIGILAAVIEMVFVDGSDNLLLPVLTLTFLRYYVNQSLTSIATNIGIMLVLMIPCLIIYKLTPVTKLSIVYSLLMAYIILLEGGVIWLIPAAMLFIMFGILPLMPKEERQIPLTYKVVECNAIIGICCLIFARLLPAYADILYLAFSLAFACHLIINTYNRLISYQQCSAVFASVCSILKAIVFISIPTFLFSELGNMAFIIYLLFLLLSINFAFYLTKKFNYPHITAEKLMGHQFFVGTLVLIFTLVLAQFIA
ncbi:MAG: hypothetical protein FWG67_09050 [Defluviitaleaceae bacterium]|nr:hypothetical protein [Defluviitaleaceae bacterium]